MYGIFSRQTAFSTTELKLGIYVIELTKIMVCIQATIFSPATIEINNSNCYLDPFICHLCNSYFSEILTNTFVAVRKGWQFAKCLPYPLPKRATCNQIYNNRTQINAAKSSIQHKSLTKYFQFYYIFSCTKEAIIQTRNEEVFHCITNISSVMN